MTVKLLNVTQFAETLGVEKQTVYTWICHKQLPKSIYFKLGRKTRFIEAEVDKWILDGASLLPTVKKSKSTEVEKGEVNTNVELQP